MKALLIVFGVLAAGVLLLVAVFGGMYNGLNSQNQEVNSSWSQVENVYQRRYDLIPNLVATVKGVANFEKSTYVDVATARASVGQLKIDASQAPKTAEELAAFQKAQGQLGSALSRLMAVSENYPQLKANQNFSELQAQIEGTENRISVERRKFNEKVEAYNTHVGAFPTVFFSGMFGFNKRPYFTANEGANVAPTVSF